MTEPAPLPPAQADPAVVAGQSAQAAYQERMAAIHDDGGLDDLARTEAVIAAYEEHNTAVTALAEDLHARRTARIAHLQGQIPYGPGIPDDATQADKAVLSTAFRAALDQARAADPPTRGQMLADAVNFGDDVRVRAVLTAIRDSPQDLMQDRLLDAWAAATGNTGVLAEIRALNEEMLGRGPGRGWVAQSLAAPARPFNEYANLAPLRQRAEQKAQEAARQRQLATPVYRRF